MAKKNALGNIMDSIFDDETDIFSDLKREVNESYTVLNIVDIEPNKDQPRKNFDEESLYALAESMEEHGIIQPLTVRPMPNGMYQIVAGERRWRAAKIAGYVDVPVRIMQLTDEETAQIALIENLQRENLNPIEEAMGYKQLIETYGMKQEELAKKVGRARSSIANSLRLLDLPEEIKALAAKGSLSSGHCKALGSVTDNSKKIELANKTVKNGLSVRSLEKLIKSENSIKAENTDDLKQKDTFLLESQIFLENYFAKPVKILKARDRIVLQFEVKDDNELKDLINNITGEG